MTMMRAAAIVLTLTTIVQSTPAQKTVLAAPRRMATLAQQKMCDEQAKKRFHEEYERDNGSRPNWTNEHTSHFDASANVCYMTIYRFATLTSDEPGAPGLQTDEVYDAFEGRRYASYEWHASPGRKYSEVPPTDCRVKPRGRAAITCTSFDEYQKLIEKYFGIGL
jgi:hypothetical protein